MASQVMVGRQQEQTSWQKCTQTGHTVFCTCSYNHISNFKNMTARNLITSQFDELTTP